MTSLVAIRCKEGVVIGSDSSATFLATANMCGPSNKRLIEKSKIVGNLNRLIVAGTGYIGHHQRFVESVRDAKNGRI